MKTTYRTFVRSKAAGVLFTVSPEPSAEAEMLGEFCPGDGDDLVSGRINPGRFSITREDAGYRFLAQPEQPDPDDTPDDLLDGMKIRTLHRIGLMLETEFGGAQDIEWTVDQNDLIQIVQARPVTIESSRNAVSRVSLTTVRKRIIDMAPTRPKARARLLPITIMTMAVTIGRITIVLTKEAE